MLKSFATPLALVASLGAAPAAFASSVEHVEIVTYGELDLARESGRRALRWRVAAAVEAVCGRPGRRPLDEVMSQRACAESAWADAQAQIERAVQFAEQRRTLVVTAAVR